jgi:hypothetical protein
LQNLTIKTLPYKILHKHYKIKIPTFQNIFLALFVFFS